MLRHKGPQPKLTDSEIITMEIVGEFLGFDTDVAIWHYFRSHWLEWFPSLGSRCNFARQAANLWCVKQSIQEVLAKRLGTFLDNTHLIDGFPMPICKYARAKRSKLFRPQATFGYCAAKQEKYYGFRSNMVIDYSGIITGFTVTPANIDERVSMFDIINQIRGLLIGDKGFIDLELQQELKAEREIDLQTAMRINMQDKRDPNFVKMLVSLRRLVETVGGQLIERFHIGKIWARDLWHLTSRVARKILSHTMAVFINRKIGPAPLQFDGLITC